MSNDNVALVKDFLASIDGAVSTKDPDIIQRLLGLLADDIRYQNKPQRLIEGQEDFLRVAFANVDIAAIAGLPKRLADPAEKRAAAGGGRW